jgi:hypothetical protein
MMATQTPIQRPFSPEDLGWDAALAKEECEGQIELFPERSRAELLALWLEFVGKPAHPQIQRALLVLVLAYKMRERAYGGLKAHVREHLRQIAETLDAERLKRLNAKEPKSGKRLLREWHGETHEVLEVEDGYLYRGETYRSLSAIAKKVTGSQWSGPVFFGTKARKARR